MYEKLVGKGAVPGSLPKFLKHPLARFGDETSPTVANGVVYIASDDGRLYAFNANTGGKPLWSYAVGAFYSCPAVANGVIYIGSEFNNALYAFHLP